METSVARLAQRLGLEQVEEDVGWRRFFGPRTRLRGAPHGREVVLEHGDLRHASGDALLAVTLATLAPRFELCPKDPLALRFLHPRSGFPRATLGESTLDDAWLLESEAPDIGPSLAPVVRMLSRVMPAMIVSTGRTLEARTAHGARAMIDDAERLLYALEEMSRALEGREPLAALPGGRAPGITQNVRCPRCGAPAGEVPAGVHHRVELQCAHCRFRGAPAPEDARAIRALRVGDASRRWAEREDRTIDGSIRSDRETSAALMVVSLASGGVMMSAALASTAHRAAAAVAPAHLAPVVGPAAGIVTGALALVLFGAATAAHILVTRERTRRQRERRDALSPSPEPIECPDFECAGCGAVLELAPTPLARCAHCGGQNLPPIERLRRAVERHSRAREVALARARATHEDHWLPQLQLARLPSNRRKHRLLRAWLADLAIALRRR